MRLGTIAFFTGIFAAMAIESLFINHDWFGTVLGALGIIFQIPIYFWTRP